MVTTANNTVLWADWGGSVGFGVIPQSKRFPVQFPIKAHAWVVGSGGACKRQPIDDSVTPRCVYIFKLDIQPGQRWAVRPLPGF